MLFDLVRFYSSANRIIRKYPTNITVNEYFVQPKFGEKFATDHLAPMISALWTCSPDQVLRFPIGSLVKCLPAHGMMSLLFRPK